MFNGDQVTDGRDRLVVTESVLTDLAYEETNGWVSIVRFDDTTTFKEAVAAIVDYRGYARSEDDIELIVEEYEKLVAEEFAYDPARRTPEAVTCQADQSY